MNFNEWLLEDRIHVITDVIFKDKLNFVIKPTGNLKRDLVLCKIFLMIDERLGKIALKNNEPIIITSTESDNKDNVMCAEFDENHILIGFHPLKVCDNDWIDWFIKKFIKKDLT